MKKITDEDGIVYEEVDYKTYLNSKNKHRIVKSLESQYFVESPIEREGSGIINFKEDKNILVSELERFHDELLKEGVCVNKLKGFKEYINRISKKYANCVEDEND